MIGATRSRVNMFLKKFTKLGFIEVNGRIKVNRSLLTVVLRDTELHNFRVEKTVPAQNGVGHA